MHVIGEVRDQGHLCRRGQIKLSQKTGLPVLREDDSASVAASRASQRTTASVARRAGETAEEKKQRKEAVKEAKVSCHYSALWDAFGNVCCTGKGDWGLDQNVWFVCAEAGAGEQKGLKADVQGGGAEAEAGRSPGCVVDAHSLETHVLPCVLSVGCDGFVRSMKAASSLYPSVRTCISANVIEPATEDNILQDSVQILAQLAAGLRLGKRPIWFRSSRPWLAFFARAILRTAVPNRRQTWGQKSFLVAAGAARRGGWSAAGLSSTSRGCGFEAMVICRQ